MHEELEARMKKETGDVNYYSSRKYYEFKFRMVKKNKKNLKNSIKKK